MPSSNPTTSGSSGGSMMPDFSSAGAASNSVGASAAESAGFDISKASEFKDDGAGGRDVGLSDAGPSAESEDVESIYEPTRELTDDPEGDGDPASEWSEQGKPADPKALTDDDVGRYLTDGNDDFELAIEGDEAAQAVARKAEPSLTDQLKLIEKDILGDDPKLADPSVVALHNFAKLMAEKLDKADSSKSQQTADVMDPRHPMAKQYHRAIDGIPGLDSNRFGFAQVAPLTRQQAAFRRELFRRADRVFVMARNEGKTITQEAAWQKAHDSLTGTSARTQAVREVHQSMRNKQSQRTPTGVRPSVRQPPSATPNGKPPGGVKKTGNLDVDGPEAIGRIMAKHGVRG